MNIVLGRVVAAWIATFASFVTVAAAAATSDPVALVTSVYRQLEADQKSFPPRYRPPDNIYTQRLRTLVAASRKRAAAQGDEVACGLDIGVWVNGQDYTLSNVRVTSRAGTAPGRTTVVANFVNIKTPQEIHFDFVLVDGKWLLDDITSVKDHRWTWSTLLNCQS